MWFKLFAFLVVCCCFAQLTNARANNNNNFYKVESTSQAPRTSSTSGGFFSSMREFFRRNNDNNRNDRTNEVVSRELEKVRREKEEDLKWIENEVRRYQNDRLENEDRGAGDANGFKILFQEAMLAKINDSVDEFDSLSNIRSRLRFGDIIEFKRVGYSHFSVYLGNNRLLQYETPEFDNISPLNVFSNFPSQTLINVIDKTANGDPVRVNNKNKLNVPVNMTAISTRVEEALQKNGTVHYNIFTRNCEHFSTWVRFGFGFSDQINALFKVGKQISTYPIRKLAAQTFGKSYY